MNQFCQSVAIRCDHEKLNIQCRFHSFICVCISSGLSHNGTLKGPLKSVRTRASSKIFRLNGVSAWGKWPLREIILYINFFMRKKYCFRVLKDQTEITNANKIYFFMLSKCALSFHCPPKETNKTAKWILKKEFNAFCFLKSVKSSFYLLKV